MNETDTLPPLRDVIAKHGLLADKSLGQHFLLDLNLTARIARAAGPFSTTSTTSTNLLVANRAVFLFGAVGLCVILAAAVVAPAVSASAFAGERERGTLDLLLLQGPGPARIVLGKVLAALMFSLLWYFVGAARARPTINVAVTLLGFVWVGVLGSYGALLLNPTLHPHRRCFSRWNQ